LCLIGPNGSTLVANAGCVSGTPFTDFGRLTLPSSGTYTLGIDPSTSSGSVSISINNDSNVTGTIAIDGAAVPVTTTVSGQDARLSFNGTAGQRIVVYATSVTTPSAFLGLVRPD